MASHDQSYRAGETKGRVEVWGIVPILCLYMVPNDCVGVRGGAWGGGGGARGGHCPPLAFPIFH